MAESAYRRQRGILTSDRGWTAVDGKLKGKKFRYVNTHLEAAAADPRNTQAAELIARGGPLRVKRKPVIVGGDFDSDPQGNESDADAVNVLKGFGPEDLWPRLRGGGPGLHLLPGQLGHVRYDGGRVRPSDRPIFSKPALRVLKGRVAGKSQSDRTANGLWPSDQRRQDGADQESA